MLRQARVAVAVVMLTCMLTLEARTEVLAGSILPDPSNAAVAEKLYRLDCGHSLANDESVWTPGENIGREIEFSSTCWLVKHGSDWLLWDTGVPEATLDDPLEGEPVEGHLVKGQLKPAGPAQSKIREILGA